MEQNNRVKIGVGLTIVLFIFIIVTCSIISAASVFVVTFYKKIIPQVRINLEKLRSLYKTDTSIKT